MRSNSFWSRSPSQSIEPIQVRAGSRLWGRVSELANGAAEDVFALVVIAALCLGSSLAVVSLEVRTSLDGVIATGGANFSVAGEASAKPSRIQ